MALTDKSTIPLNITDLRVIEGKPRFNDGRLATRLDIDRRWWRRRITQDEALAVENGLPSLCRSGTKSSGGRPYEDFLLTIAETIFYASRSEAKNAPKLIAEVALVVEALRTGAQIPDTPWTDALFAPERPTIERGDDNVVEVKWEQPLLDLDLPTTEPKSKPARHHYTDEECFEEIEEAQRRGEELAEEFGFKPSFPPAPAADDEDDAIARRIWLDPEARRQTETWRDQESEWVIDVVATHRPDGDPCSVIDFSRRNFYNTETTGARTGTEMQMFMSCAKGRVLLRCEHTIPRAVIERAVIRVTGEPLTEWALVMLDEYLAF